MPPRCSRQLARASLTVLLAALGWLPGCSLRAPAQHPFVDVPAPLTTWPWPQAVRDTPHPGVTHWLDRSSADGTTLDLFDFDFQANPHLKLELYDQDEDDLTPGDDNVDYWAQGVGQATHHLNQIGRGPVVAAWNGLFFGADATGGAHGIAHHVAPVVLRGRVLYNVGCIRWAFGVQEQHGRPIFQTLHQPDRAALARTYTWAAEGAQCLIRDGVPLKLQPFPRIDEPAPRQPVPSAPDEAGFIPVVDHIQTSRTSMAWSKDNGHFFLLIVKRPIPEGSSVEALRLRQPTITGGWTVADEQRFWRAKGVWGAINIDGGDVTQLAYSRPDGRYDVIPPHWTVSDQRLSFGPDFTGAPAGGTLMYFYVRDTQGKPD